MQKGKSSRMTSVHKVALITGAAGGIGSATVELYCQRQWNVIAVDRAKLNQPASLAIEADLSKPDEIDRVLMEVRSQYPHLDALINNAAEQLCRPLLETKLDEWERIMGTNVRAAYLMVSGLYSLLHSVRGCIVNVASIHALATSPGMAAYAASKGALVSLTRSMAVEFAADGIRVNAVLPGAVDTPMLAAGMKRSHLSISSPPGLSSLEALAARHPLGRLGRPSDVAQAIYFLADNESSSFVTGQTLVVDGGAYARLSTE
jgi:NAD(P)-dependent dehydrogenase (short-subunit alcohol dehydrogenase family)